MAIDVPAIQHPHKYHRAVVHSKADAIVTEPDPVVTAESFQWFYGMCLKITQIIKVRKCFNANQTNFSAHIRRKLLEVPQKGGLKVYPHV